MNGHFGTAADIINLSNELHKRDMVDSLHYPFPWFFLLFIYEENGSNDST